MDHSIKLLSEKELMWLGKEIIQSHSNYKLKSMMEKYNLVSRDILTG